MVKKTKYVTNFWLCTCIKFEQRVNQTNRCGTQETADYQFRDTATLDQFKTPNRQFSEKQEATQRAGGGSFPLLKVIRQKLGA